MSTADATLMTTAEVAEMFRKSRVTVARWVREGKLEPFAQPGGVGGTYLFDREVVMRFARQSVERVNQ